MHFYGLLDANAISITALVKDGRALASKDLLTDEPLIYHRHSQGEEEPIGICSNEITGRRSTRVHADG